MIFANALQSAAKIGMCLSLSSRAVITNLLRRSASFACRAIQAITLARM